MDSQIAEVARVRDHIARAEQQAARRDLSALSRVQRMIRQLLLRELARYRAGGRFPQNPDFADKTPYFVDASGTRCAMAHLLELGGEAPLVARIARERNNARVRELADEPRLLAWLAAAGLTVEEAAAIQPEYCSKLTDCVCGGDFSFIEYPVPAKGVLEGVVISAGKARVERIYGDAVGVSVGNEVALSVDHIAVGTRVLAPLETVNDAPFGAVALDTAGLYECSSQGIRDAPPLDAAEFARAVMATDCPAELEAIDAAWARNSCEEGGTEDPTPHGRPVDDSGFAGLGCSAGAGSEAASVGILLALVAAIARRK